MDRKDDYPVQRPPVPAVPDLDRKLYEVAGQPGALNMQNWHTCGTTHCRAGWIVTLAGEQGETLEDCFDTSLAAMMIYEKSTGEKLSPVKFFESNEAALADMKARAEQS